MKLLSNLKENVQSAGFEDWFWWLVIVPILALGGLRAYKNGELLQDIGGAAKIVIIVLVGVPLSILVVQGGLYWLSRKTKK